MSDRVESRQVAFDAGSRDAQQGVSDEMILLWKNRPQVQQNSTFFDSGDHWRIRLAQTTR
jgi:hypothetical protein